MGRTDKAVVLKQIYEDYDYAAENLPAANNNSGATRVDKGTAYAYKARAALYQHDYGTAANAAQDCMDLEVYDLAPDYGELFRDKTRGSKEVIFSVAHSSDLELDENGNTKEGGLQVEGAVMMPTYMKNDDQKAIFNGAKTNTVLVFNPATAFDNNEAELASLLKIKKEEVANYKGNFSFQIEEITRMIPGDLNQELFDQVLGEGKAHSEEEFRAQIKETIAKQFEADSDYKFLIDVRNYVVNKIGKLEFADELMKRIMLENNKEKGEEFVAEHYEKSIEELTWHLIKEKLVAANNIKVEQADITNMAKEATRAQFAQYGMINVPDELLENYSKEMLKKRESVEALINRVIETKLSEILKGQVTLNHKAVSAEEFNKMFQ